MSALPKVVDSYPGWSQENKGPMILGVTGTLTGTAFLFVVARLYSRVISLGQLRIDDYIVILSIVGFIHFPKPLVNDSVLPPSPQRSHAVSLTT